MDVHALKTIQEILWAGTNFILSESLSGLFLLHSLLLRPPSEPSSFQVQPVSNSPRGISGTTL